MTSSVSEIDYDRGRVTAGIVHFGLGNFHRAHEAMYVDRLLRDPELFEDASGWGIVGVGVLPADVLMRDALASQQNEYTLIERHPGGSAPATRIGSIVEYLFAPDDPELVVERLAKPETRIVSLSITEGGYNVSDATGAFDVSNPSVIEDAKPGAVPSTVFGFLIEGLRRRRLRGIAPFTVMSCDNIEGNGDTARNSFVAFAGMSDKALATWIENEVAFPNSMVDRITPVTTAEDREWVRSEYGVVDAWPVLSEDYVQWVLEDDFPLGRPNLAAVGVQLVDDVRPYELMKLRLLNASHQALAYVGLLSGYEYVHEAASDPEIKRFVAAYMDREATPTLSEVPGVDLTEYKARLLQRFANPFVRDTLARLATDASDRIPKWLVPVVRECRATGAGVPLSASIIASWANYAERVFDGEAIPFRDRQEANVRAAVLRLKADPTSFLRDANWFGDLGLDEAFADEFVFALDRFRAYGDVRIAIREVVDDV